MSPFAKAWPVLLLAASGAMAQLSPGSALPEALKTIKPATGVCRRDEAPAAKTANQSTLEGPSPDLLCAITPADLSALRGRADATVVDVRGRAAHEAFHVGSALNMTVSELRTKAVLRGKTLVLMGDGKAERELYAACADLKSRGFKRVSVLRGGMPSWLSHGGAVEGRAPDLAQSVRLSSAELWGESQFEANLVLVTDAQEALHSRLPYSMRVRDESAAAIKSMIERRRKELKNAPLAAVVLVASAAVPDEALKRTAQAIEPVPLLVYSESSDTYMRQIAQLKASWVAQARGPKRPGCGL